MEDATNKSPEELRTSRVKFFFYIYFSSNFLSLRVSSSAPCSSSCFSLLVALFLRALSSPPLKKRQSVSFSFSPPLSLTLATSLKAPHPSHGEKLFLAPEGLLLPSLLLVPGRLLLPSLLLAQEGLCHDLSTFSFQLFRHLSTCSSCTPHPSLSLTGT